jgi:membrane protease YdiL (CAAX protease family)
LLAVFFATQLINLSVAVSAYQLGWLSEEATEMVQLVLQVLTVPLVCFTCLALMMRARGLKLRQWVNTGPADLARHVRIAIIGYLAMLPFVAAVQCLNVPLLEFFKIPIDRQNMVELLMNPEYPLWLRTQLILMAVTAAPIVEELLFRGIALPALLKRMGTVRAICLVSLIFALIHFHVPSILPLFVVAFAFSLGYLYSETLLVPILMHAIFNGVNLAVMLVTRDMPGLTD